MAVHWQEQWQNVDQNKGKGWIEKDNLSILQKWKYAHENKDDMKESDRGGENEDEEKRHSGYEIKKKTSIKGTDWAWSSSRGEHTVM